MGRLFALFLGVATLAIAPHARAATPAPLPAIDCPKSVPAESKCFAGADANGAYDWIVIPPKTGPNAWNGSLVVHTHGGPSLKKPFLEESVPDLERFIVTVQEGFAWAGSSYRHAGFGVRDAAADSDNLRRIFWTQFGRPKHTLLHGQSWGGNVAAKTAELYGTGEDGKPTYDGVILTSGVLGGGSKSYDFRADLRAVYQFYCHNMPASSEMPYPLWQGLPVGEKLKREEVAERINACTGVDLPAASRTASQQRALTNILTVVHIPARTLFSHMDWATFTFRDLVSRQLHGANPFSNTGVVYAGSDDDAALNKGVERFAATQAGVDALAYDADLTGKLTVPTLTLHAKDDPTAFVELENEFRDTVAKAGASALLVQSFTDEHEHQKEATPEYAALFRAMIAWIEKGEKPSPATLAAGCEQAKATYGEACHFDVGYFPPPLASRVYARVKPTPSGKP